MSDDDIEAAIERALKKVLEARKEAFWIPDEQHYDQHKFIARFMKDLETTTVTVRRTLIGVALFVAAIISILHLEALIAALKRNLGL